MVVIGEITAEKPFEMALIKDNSVIQTLPADTANEAFDIGILPRASRRAGTFGHSQTARVVESDFRR